MPEVYSQTDQKTFHVSLDDTILEASRKAGIHHMHVCGGNARCSTCRVYVMEGLENCLPRNDKEKALAEKLSFSDHIRLACQTRISGDIVIRRPVIDDLDIEIILRQLEDGPGSKLGQEKELAILFTDIVNYTPFAEAFPAYDVVHVLNRYYQTMNDIIMHRKGVISDVAGDGILALFGILEARENPVWDAVTAVRDMNRALTPFNEYLTQMYGRSFGIRAGINYGSVIVGNFDTGMMNKISAIGDAVNMASRIEEANKVFGTELLISESAQEKIKGLAKTRKRKGATLKGKSGVYDLYEVSLG